MLCVCVLYCFRFHCYSNGRERERKVENNWRKKTHRNVIEPVSSVLKTNNSNNPHRCSHSLMLRLSDMLTYWAQCNERRHTRSVHTMWHAVLCIALSFALSLYVDFVCVFVVVFFGKRCIMFLIQCPSRCNKIYCNIDFVLFLYVSVFICCFFL